MTGAPSSVVDELTSRGIVAVIRSATKDDARDLVADLGSARLAIEITFTVPGAAELIREAATCGVLVGAGTVLTREHAETAIACGARFLVSPVSQPWFVELGLDRDVLPIPGCATPTEVDTALGRGASLIKIFPAARLGGPAYLQDLRAPFGDVRLMPTGGVRPQDVTAYREAGAACVGLGGALSLGTRGVRRDRARKVIDGWTT